MSGEKASLQAAKHSQQSHNTPTIYLKANRANITGFPLPMQAK